MNRTRARMADGRELLYYDDSAVGDAPARPSSWQPPVDDRDLPPVVAASEIRYDALLSEWVAMASHRQTRTHLPPTDECPLCPTRDGRATEVPSPDYDVVVFENRFPSLAPDVPPVDPLVDGEGLFRRAEGIGRCEVVCFTSEHTTSFAGLTPRRVRTVMGAWADRTRELALVPGVEHVAPFENRGEEIGVTLSHPHGQIYAYPFVPPRTQRMIEAARCHRDRTGGDLLADVLAAEQRAGTRVVLRSEHWTAFVPAAARWPVEVHVHPHRRVPDLAALTTDEQADFAELYLDLLNRMDRLYDVPLPYIAAWHQAPVRLDRDLTGLHLQVTSVKRAANKLKYLAGSESAMGVFINDVLPEQAAEALRTAGR